MLSKESLCAELEKLAKQASESTDRDLKSASKVLYALMGAMKAETISALAGTVTNFTTFNIPSLSSKTKN